MDKHGKVRIILGLVLAAAAVFACLALVSYSESDPGGWNWSSGKDIRNWCGVTGAYFSSFLIHYFGTAAVSFAVGLAVFWAYLLLGSRQRLSDAYLKILGSVLLVVAVSAVSALAGSGLHFPSTVGSVTAHYCSHYFGVTGAYVVLGLAAVLSLLLATDFMVVSPAGRLALGIVRFARAVLTRMLHFVVRRVKAHPLRPPAPAHVTRPEDVKPAVAKKPAPVPVRVPSPEPARRTAEAESPAEAAPRTHHIPAAAAVSEEGYRFPPVSLLEDTVTESTEGRDEFIQEKAQVLKETLAEFGIEVEIVGIETGPAITQYEIALAPGIKVTRVVSLSDDIAMALKAPSVRIVAPIPGRDSIGVEVPNAAKSIVNLKQLLSERPRKTARIPIYVGRDARGEAIVSDLTEMPHLLIAGTTGSGKSVCINSIILSVLMQKHPDDVKFLLVDPKMVELAVFRDLPHLMCPVVTDVKKAAAILEWACVEMDARYDYLSAVGVRHISRYNKLGPSGLREKLMVPDDADIELPDKLPYIVIIIDELADLMTMSAKEIEASITRLAQKSRAVGIHLVLATQRPSVDVITGLIKSNLPARVSFKVFSRIDSRTILDQSGAEKLLGEGDMLFLPPATAKLIRAQGTFVSDDEIRRVTEFVKEQATPDYDEELVEWKAEEKSAGAGGHGAGDGSCDPLYDQAVRMVIENQRGSVSLLQRKLEIGYGRAARLIDFMAEGGILGPYKGSQAREVLYTCEQWDEMQKQLKKNRSL
ncbi:MAG: DNA translocase FtsK 4TM domain-containing protein [Planctomycetes bacterium]|nr:DNA translocase FtsK 4TM domain-containing protein [Planctomycetota bacterium]